MPASFPRGDPSFAHADTLFPRDDPSIPQNDPLFPHVDTSIRRVPATYPFVRTLIRSVPTMIRGVPIMIPAMPTMIQSRVDDDSGRADVVGEVASFVHGEEIEAGIGAGSSSKLRRAGKHYVVRARKAIQSYFGPESTQYA